MRTVRVTFSCPAHATLAVEQGLRLGYRLLRFERPRPRPLRCYSCQRFGHGSSRCPHDPRCSTCGDHHPFDKDHPCQRPIKCANCGASHKASSARCPVYLKHLPAQFRPRATGRNPANPRPPPRSVPDAPNWTDRPRPVSYSVHRSAPIDSSSAPLYAQVTSPASPVHHIMQPPQPQHPPQQAQQRPPDPSPDITTAVVPFSAIPPSLERELLTMQQRFLSGLEGTLHSLFSQLTSSISTLNVRPVTVPPVLLGPQSSSAVPVSQVSSTPPVRTSTSWRETGRSLTPHPADSPSLPVAHRTVQPVASVSDLSLHQVLPSSQ